MIVYDKLWAYLKSKNLKRYFLFKNGIDWPTIHRLEENQIVKTSTLAKICLILKCDLQDISHFDPNCQDLTKQKNNEQ